MHFFHWSFSLSFSFSHDYHFHASGWHFCPPKRFELCRCGGDLWRWSESSLWHESVNLRLCDCAAIYCLINRGTVKITTRTNIAHLLQPDGFTAQSSACLALHYLKFKRTFCRSEISSGLQFASLTQTSPDPGSANCRQSCVGCVLSCVSLLGCVLWLWNVPSLERHLPRSH